MKFEKIVTNGNYIYTGFEIERFPETLEKGEADKPKTIGSMNIFFRKDNTKYFINNEVIKDTALDLPLGVFQPFNSSDYLLQDFSIDVTTTKEVNIVSLSVIEDVKKKMYLMTDEEIKKIGKEENK
jgi:hypothetical protein